MKQPTLPQEPLAGLWSIAWGYSKISLLSFGGGLNAWAYRVIVEEKRWLTNMEFLSALAFCRILPGPNQVNLAVYVGTLLRGLPGAVSALAGLIVLPFFIVLAAGILYFHLQQVEAVEAALRGMAIIAVGMTAGMGVKMTINQPFSYESLLIGLSLFFAIGILRWPLIPVLAVALPISIAFSYRAHRKAARRGHAPNE